MWEPDSETLKEIIIEKLKYTVSHKKLAEVVQFFNDYTRTIEKEVTDKLEETLMLNISTACYIEVLNILSEESFNVTKLEKEELEKHLKEKTLITYLESKRNEVALFNTIIDKAIGADAFNKIIAASMFDTKLSTEDCKSLNAIHRVAYKGFFKKLDEEFAKNPEEYCPESYNTHHNKRKNGGK